LVCIGLLHEDGSSLPVLAFPGWVFYHRVKGVHEGPEVDGTTLPPAAVLDRLPLNPHPVASSRGRRTLRNVRIVPCSPSPCLRELLLLFYKPIVVLRVR